MMDFYAKELFNFEQRRQQLQLQMEHDQEALREQTRLAVNPADANRHQMLKRSK